MEIQCSFFILNFGKDRYIKVGYKSPFYLNFSLLLFCIRDASYLCCDVPSTHIESLLDYKV